MAGDKATSRLVSSMSKMDEATEANRSPQPTKGALSSNSWVLTYK